MGEYIVVKCRTCNTVLEEVWEENLDRRVTVAIEPNIEACECLQREIALAEDESFEDGYREGRAEKDD